MADKTCKYYREQKYVSTDYGETYLPVEIYRRGALYETDSQDCVDYTGKYFTFEAIDNCTFGISLKDSDAGQFSEYRIEYSLDNGNTWNVLLSTDSPISVGAGSKVYWRNFFARINPTYYYFGTGMFTSTGRFDAYGNVMSLCWGDDFENKTTTRQRLSADVEGTEYIYKYYRFTDMLKNNTGLINTEHMILPATEGFHQQVGNETSYIYNENIYKSMFEGCTSLVTSPQEICLVDVPRYGCKNMFKGCTSLTTVPKIDAARVSDEGFESMFDGCESLVSIVYTLPSLSATSWDYNSVGATDSHYKCMFKGCSNLEEAPSISINSGAYLVQMFSGCTDLTDVPDISASWMDATQMFKGCTSLEVSPNFPTDGNTLSGMFEDCQSLSSITISSITHSTCNEMYKGCSNLVDAGIVLSGCTQEYMFNNCTNLETPPTIITYSDTWNSGSDYGYSCKGMFMNCISLVTPPSISVARGGSLYPSDTYASQFESMFENCTSLISAATINSIDIYPNYPDVIAEDAYKKMYKGCSSLTAATPINCAAAREGALDSMYEGCISLTIAPSITCTNYLQKTVDMFKGCSALTTSSEITVKNIYQSGCTGMFSGLTSLTTMSPITIGDEWGGTIGDDALNSMFKDCTSLTNSSGLTVGSRVGVGSYGMSSMFEGCTSLTTAPSAIPVSSVTASSCAYMFKNTSITTAPELPSVVIGRACYYGMFSGCTALTTAMTVLPGYSPKQSCYAYMFAGCTSLTRAPELPENLSQSSGGKSAYNGMFSGCTSLNYIKCLTTNVPSDDYGYPSCTANWVNGVAATGTFVKNASTTWPTGTKWVNGSIPDGWTVIDAT